MISKRYRLQELINPRDGRSLVVDTSNGLSLGALPGLESYEEAVTPLLPWVDGVVASPGQSRFLMTRSKQDAGLLICADWTNAFRDRSFVLPPEHIHYLPLIDAADALDLGANALVMQFLLGHEETIDAHCLKRVVQLAMQGSSIGMPLIVDVHPIGPRVVLRPKAIELGVSYALEGGADGIAIPWPGGASFADIRDDGRRRAGVDQAADSAIAAGPANLTKCSSPAPPGPLARRILFAARIPCRRSRPSPHDSMQTVEV